jgi:hypothetical protein
VIHIVIAGHKTVASALGSAVSQSIKAKVWAVCCGSEITAIDRGEEAFIWFRKEKTGAAQNYFQLLNQYVFPEARPEDIVCFIDGDDRLNGTHALEPVLKTYTDPNVLLTYGSYKRKSNGKVFGVQYRSKEMPRTSFWRATHLKTIRVMLIRLLKAEDMKDDNGNWLNTCSDLAIMFPMIEKAGLERTAFIPQVIYEYNDENPENDYKVNPVEQMNTALWLRKKSIHQRILW